MENRPLLGAHMSVNGGIHTAFRRGTSIGCTTMQVFVKNNNRWSAPPLTDEDIRSYKRSEAKATISPVVAHAAYLINLCARNPSTLKNSRAAFTDELRRCNALGIRGLIFHPGAHVGAGEPEGIKRIAESLDSVHAATPECTTLSVLECTAGQGTMLGYRFEQLQAITELVDAKERMAVCLDTCHLFAAGYDISTEEGWERTFTEFEQCIGFERLVAVHVNDSKKELASRVDRHEHIGKGRIGLEAFRRLMNEPRFDTIPKILETEKSEDMHEDVENMGVLRSLIHTP